MTTKFLIDTGPSERGVHRLETAGLCPQLFSYTYNLGLMQVTSPLVRGTLGHVGLAHYYARMAAVQRKLDPEVYFSPLDAIDEKVRRMVANNEPGWTLAKEHCEEMKKIVLGYINNFSTERHEVWAVEHVVEMQFHGYRLTQRLDLVIKDRNGRFWAYDHKFVGKIESKTVTRYSLSPQFLEMYHQCVNLFGSAFGGLRINLVGANGEFIRASPAPAPFALQMFPRYVQQREEEIASWTKLDLWDYPKAFGERSCMTPYGPCAGTELCLNGKPSSDAPSDDAIRLATPHG